MNEEKHWKMPDWIQMNMISKEGAFTMAKAKKITDEKILAFVEKENWIDYQAVFTKRYELTRQLNLEEALGRAEIEPEGRFHDGLDDAVNTGYLIEKLELNPDYQLVMRCRKSRQNIFRVILENCLQS